jgi:peroxiredoxin
MAATPSVMKPLGSQAPDFRLTDTITGKDLSLSEMKGEVGTVIMFICNHCPYVKLLNDVLVKIARSYQQKNISFIAISSNDAAQYPDDGPAQMKVVATQLGYSFPYLYDESQEVARAYDAACTPDFFVYDKNLRLAYRGQFDDARPGNNKEVNGKDLSAALDAMIANKPVPQDQRPSIGCNIKWRKV